MPARKILRRSRPLVRYQKRKRTKELSILWVLGIVALSTLLAFGINAQLGSSQNELESSSYLERISSTDGNFEQGANTGVFDNEVVTTPTQVASNPNDQVLSASVTAEDGSEKWIEVDLSEMRLKAWEGGRLVYEFKTSTGRPGYETVTGEFRVWRKVAWQRYIGGSRARGDYYNLPNVPFSLFFHQGYAIHGAYWHNDFGIRRRSSGCINLSHHNAEAIFNWAGPSLPTGMNALNSSPENPGVRVVVHS